MHNDLMFITGMLLLSAGSWGCTSSTATAIDCSTPSGAGSTSTDQVDALGCPVYDAGGSCGVVSTPEITEASGLAASRKTPNVLWTHNDSGDDARIIAISTAGTYLGTFYLSNAAATDWEDIAIGPGPQAEASYIYVGDIGDNDKSRTEVNVFRVLEPDVATTGTPVVKALSGVETFTFVYPDKPHDAETLLVDPLSGDVFFVAKADSGKSPIYRAAGPLTNSGPMTLELVATLEFGTAPLTGTTTTTGGDISPDGLGIAIRTYDSAYLWLRGSNTRVDDALQFKPCSMPLQEEKHGEALAFAANSRGYFTLSEGSSQPLYFYAWK